MFTPFPDKIVIKPHELPSFSDDQKFYCKGEVITVGSAIGDWCKPGDILFFRPHGIDETQEHEGVTYYTVQWGNEFIIGKYAP